MENDIIDVLTDRLRVLMREYNVKAAPLARRAQLNESAVRDILRGRSKNPGIVTLKKIASVLNLRPSALFEAEIGWQIEGVVAAEGEVENPSKKELTSTEVPNPFFFQRSGDYGALLNGSSALEPLSFTGDFLIFEKHDDSVRETDLGKPCICTLKGNRRVVRVPKMGDKSGKYHLTPVGLYGSPELNVDLVSASRIALSLPQEFVPNLPAPTHEVSGRLQEEKGVYKAAKK